MGRKYVVLCVLVLCLCIGGILSVQAEESISLLPPNHAAGNTSNPGAPLVDPPGFVDPYPFGPSTFAAELFTQVRSVLNSRLPQGFAANNEVVLRSSPTLPDVGMTVPTGPKYRQDNFMVWQQVGWRYVIVYNPALFGQLSLMSGNRYVHMYVFAHELGHVISLSKKPLLGMLIPRTTLSSWADELDADREAGYALAKLGAGPEDTKAALRLSWNWLGTATHPGTMLRIQAAAKGYLDGGGTNIEADLTTLCNSVLNDVKKWYPEAATARAF